jgi:hypothetical protein
MSDNIRKNAGHMRIGGNYLFLMSKGHIPKCSHVFGFVSHIVVAGFRINNYVLGYPSFHCFRLVDTSTSARTSASTSASASTSTSTSTSASTHAGTGIGIGTSTSTLDVTNAPSSEGLLGGLCRHRLWGVGHFDGCPGIAF